MVKNMQAQQESDRQDFIESMLKINNSFSRRFETIQELITTNTAPWEDSDPIPRSWDIPQGRSTSVGGRQGLPGSRNIVPTGIRHETRRTPSDSTQAPVTANPRITSGSTENQDSGERRENANSSPLTEASTQIGSTSNNTLLGPSNTSAQCSSLKLEAPTFHGKAEELPMQFLVDLRGFRDAYVPRYHFKVVISQCLQGLARQWWKISRDYIPDWGTFEKQFTRRFWSRERQDNARTQLEFEFHDVNNKISRVAYAMKFISLARDLRPPLSEHEVMDKIKKHFPEDVRATIRILGIKTLPEFLDLLSAIDEEGPGNRFRTKPEARERFTMKKNPSEFSHVEKNPAVSGKTEKRDANPRDESKFNYRNKEINKNIRSIETVDEETESVELKLEETSLGNEEASSPEK